MSTTVDNDAMDTKKRLGERVDDRLKELGVGQQWLVDKVLEIFPDSDFDIGNAWAIISRKNRTSKYAAQMATALGVTHTWLTDGLDPKLLDNSSSTALQAGQGTERYISGKISPKTKRQNRIDEIVALANMTDDEGLAVLLFKSREIATDYPLKIKQTL